MKGLAATVCIAIAIAIIVGSAAYAQASSIPRIIWTFWHDTSQIPPLITKCIETWRFNNPSYRIEVLDVQRVKELCSIDLTSLNIPVDFKARYADYARIFVVERYGGIWMDATTICTEPLDWVHAVFAQSRPDFIGYYAPHTTNKRYPIPENSFFACPAKSPFMSAWLKEALYMNTAFSNEIEYNKHIQSNDVYDLQNIQQMLPYLSMHLCAMVVQQTGSYNLWLKDVCDGPFKWLSRNDWDSTRALKALCYDRSIITPVIKLRGVDRAAYESGCDSCLCIEAWK